MRRIASGEPATLAGSQFAHFEEGVSWGKVKREALNLRVFSYAAITVPLVLHALNASGKGRKI